MPNLREKIALLAKKISDDQSSIDSKRNSERQRQDSLYQEEERKILSSPEHRRLLKIANNEIREILQLLHENFSKRGAFNININSMARLGGIKVVAQDGTPVFDNPFGFVEVKMELGNEDGAIYIVQLSYRGTDAYVSLSRKYWESDVLGEKSWQSGHGCYGTLEEVQNGVVEIIARHRASQQRKRYRD